MLKELTFFMFKLKWNFMQINSRLLIEFVGFSFCLLNALKWKEVNTHLN